MAKMLRHKLVAASTVAAVAGMLGMAYAAVPLYRMFCAATGYNGTTQVAASPPQIQGQRSLTVRFDANVAPGLDWAFAPETNAIKLQTGKTATVFFKVTNNSRQQTRGLAQYNVSPDAAGAYFDKLACFCFSEQTLEPGETIDMPVVFFLDPALERDEIMRNVDSLTLSYTFFASKAAPLAAAGQALKKL